MFVVVLDRFLRGFVKEELYDIFFVKDVILD